MTQWFEKPLFFMRNHGSIGHLHLTRSLEALCRQLTKDSAHQNLGKDGFPWRSGRPGNSVTRGSADPTHFITYIGIYQARILFQRNLCLFRLLFNPLFYGVHPTCPLAYRLDANILSD